MGSISSFSVDLFSFLYSPFVCNIFGTPITVARSVDLENFLDLMKMEDMSLQNVKVVMTLYLVTEK